MLRKTRWTLSLLLALSLGGASATVFGQGKGDKGNKECNGREIHERTEHNIAERAAERAIGGLREIHEKALERQCELDKLDKARKP